MERVAAEEEVKAFVRAAGGRFLAQMLYNPVRAGVAAADDLVLAGKRALYLGEACWHRVVKVVDLSLGGEASVGEWEVAIVRVQGGYSLLFIDGSSNESVKVGGGWLGSRQGSSRWQWALWPPSGTGRLQVCRWRWSRWQSLRCWSFHIPKRRLLQ